VSDERLGGLLAELCQSFGGWDLLLDAGRLTTLGSGDMTLDLRRGSCRHNLRWHPPLVAGRRLRARLLDALPGLAIDWDSVTFAELSVRLRIAEQKGQRLSKVVWARRGPDDIFVGCDIEIAARMVVQDQSYTASWRGRQEWPKEWRG